jgi:FkbM family methyltransferase
MKVLFLMRHAGYLWHFESALREFCARGHHVHLAFHTKAPHWLANADSTVERLAAECPTFSSGRAPFRADPWGLLGQQLRVDLDYLRYFGEAYRDAPKLRRRAEEGVDETVIRAARKGPARRRWLGRALRLMDHSTPRDPGIDRFMEQQSPDVVLVTPMVRDGSPQSDYVRSARARGIRTAFCVASWDNLTNKGLIHDTFDLVTVWNEAMKREAIELHGVPANRVAVTGAQSFDGWFDAAPALSREDFCARAGLDPARPYLLYVCSSAFVAPDEASFVRTWIQRVRQSGSALLQRAGILVRPHPQNEKQWRRFDATGLENVAIYPPMGAAPVDAAARADYFDSIYYSAAVVGINTTAEIESAIVGRQVYSVLAPEFRDTQHGTLHFHHLRDVNGGLLHVAESLADHVTQLDAALRGGGVTDDRSARFVEGFVRPYGLDTPAAPRFVNAVEALGRSAAPRTAKPPAAAGMVQRLLRPLADRVHREAAAAAAEAARLKAARKQERTADAPRRVIEPGVDLLDYEGAEIRLQVTSKTERRRLRSCAKEPFTVAWIERMIGQGEVLYDIGANVGAYALVAAKKPSGAARVIAFEASFDNIAALSRNIVLNNAGAAVTPLPIALSNSNGLGTFNLRMMEAGSAKHMLEAESPDGPTLYAQPVITYRLDDAIVALGLARPNHIKLDVDGSEMAVLEGARETLRSPALRTMLVEVSTEVSEEVAALLADAGFQPFWRAKVRSKSGAFRVWYGLFARDTTGWPPFTFPPHPALVADE